MSDTFDLSDTTYSYSCASLLASWDRLAEQESELTALTAAQSWDPSAATAAMATTVSDDIIVVAATQITGAGLPPSDVAGFCFRSEQAIEQAVRQGANVIVLPQLWSGPYFCQSQDLGWMGLASELDDALLIRRMRQLAKLYGVVLAVSFYEKRNQALYSSVCVVDSDGSLAGVYRQGHLAERPGNHEKYFFSPGDTGFKVFSTNFVRIGVAAGHDVCFPESVRALSLQGADVVVIPVAIGTDPQSQTSNNYPWQRILQGQAAANMIPIVCSNRFGTEIFCNMDGSEQRRFDFEGRSFIADATGNIEAQCDANEKEKLGESGNGPIQVIVAEIDIRTARTERLAMGLFRDRRPDLYHALLTMDGKGHAE